MDLFLLRHGEAGSRADSPGEDAQRPLTTAGRKEIARISESLQALGIGFDVIAASPLKRTLETAEIVARKFRKLNLLEKWEELKPTAESKDLYKKLARLKMDSTVMLVGHEPNLSSIIGDIIAGDPGVNIALKKGGLARVRIASFKPKISGELRLLLTPKLATKISR